ncbi:MAG: 16S rRNA (cytidine(1402)-2'-O)-methyltransferase [Gammaproteobacteria bacterium]|nr:16S rRNA (cytidine(1402)-2'-O)-methyltransferase [Gammaproteobacteria bacterium]
MNKNNFGILYVVATPIGNMQDMSLRAIEVLKTVDCIVAEDTRHSQPLLRHFLITTPIIALHEHNEREKTKTLLERLEKGESIALISDAGTPLISDPGYYLVREARVAGIKTVPVPGACAAIAALSVAGLPTDRFVFEGFLPAKSGPRMQRLQALNNETRTMIFYESPHRILDLLEAMRTAWAPTRSAVIAREVTKLFETITSGTLEELINWVKSDTNQERGEMVVVVEGMKEDLLDTQETYHDMLVILLDALPLKQAVELVTKITGQKKNTVYNLALKISNNKPIIPD